MPDVRSRVLRRCLAVSGLVVTLALLAQQPAAADETGTITLHARAHRHFNNVKHYKDCRTGWWQFYYDGVPRPSWGTLCRWVSY